MDRYIELVSQKGLASEGIFHHPQILGKRWYLGVMINDSFIRASLIESKESEGTNQNAGTRQLAVEFKVYF